MSEMLRCELFTADLDATVGFYTRVLRFRLVHDERAAEHSYAAFQRGQVRVGAAARAEVADSDQRRPPVGVELVLEVADVWAERAHVATAKWPLVEDVMERPWG